MSENEEGDVEGDTCSFIVRIWNEGSDSDARITDWRGSVDCIGNGHQLHFYDLERLVQFIQEQVGLQSGRSRAPKRAGSGLDQP